MPRSRETVALVRPSLPVGRRHASFARAVLLVRPSLPVGRRHTSFARVRGTLAAVAPCGASACLVRASLRPSRPSLPVGRRHASFAQTVLACSETGASVRSWSLTAAARQLSSQAAELALRGMPRPLFRDGRLYALAATRSVPQRRAVRSDRAALRCAALGVAKAARTVHSEAGAGPAERRTRARAKPGGASASAQPGSEGARGRARSAHSRPGGASASAQPWARGSERTSAERTLAPGWSERVRAATGPRER
jgi:hypothetical protein